ncbi:hypothetical protein QYE76_031522 [Lolium multiflorum]|uniref:Integrase catalytic domain-containing protein n=1 Tax=Lolium multiflorum TaxID=4521 RepID=A0AAD8VIJ2_LOLMU|nr:hypothetical protein QYE76_031522 [Lolium multiflorum]
MRLRENHDLLQATYKEVLATLKDPIIVENIAYVSNSTIDQALLIEENNKFKEQLEKECLTPPTKGKTLDDVLAHQKVRAHKQGIRYNPRKDKNGATPPKEVNFVQEGHKVDGNANKAFVNGGATRGNPNCKFSGKNNPSYVLWLCLWWSRMGCMTGGKGVLDDFVNAINSTSSISSGDNSKGKFKNYTMSEFFQNEWIKHEFSTPYTPQENGVAERKNQNLIEMARTMMDEFKPPYNFWGETISTTVHYENQLFLRPLHNKTPYDLITGNKPNVMHFRVFGCKCMVKNKE